MTTTVLRQGVGCRVRVTSASPSQVRVRNGVAHVSAGVSPIRRSVKTSA